MPRGIPKDPNHPRNKNRLVASGATPSAEPKRRGRPPGKKNAVKASATPAQLKAEPRNTEIRKSAAPVGINNDVALRLVRENIDVISKAHNLLSAGTGAATALSEALAKQIKELMRLTDETLHPDTEDEPPAKPQTQPVVQTQAPVPQQVPTIVQTQPNNLPTPPSFVPPPFPPIASPQ